MNTLLWLRLGAAFTKSPLLGRLWGSVRERDRKDGLGRMAFIPVPDCVEVVIRGTWGGQIVSITLGFCKGTEVTETDMDDLADALFDWVTDDLSDLQATTFTWNNINVTNLSSATALSKDYPMTVAGGAIAPTVTNNVTPVITFSTDQRGRSYRGRNYLPGAPSGAMASSVAVTGAFVTSALTAYANLATIIATTVFTHVVISRYTNGAPRTEGIGTPITAYSMDTPTDSQRRRLSGRGL